MAAAADFLMRRPDIDVVYGNGNHIDEHDRIIEPYPTEDWDFERAEGALLPVPAGGVLPATAWWSALGPLGVHRRYAMDYEYWLRLGKSGVRFARIGALLAGSAAAPRHQDLVASRVKVHAEINDMLRSLLGRAPDRWLYNYAHAVLDDRGILAAAAASPRRWRRSAWWSALRWNHISISPPMLRQGGQWIGGVLARWPHSPRRHGRARRKHGETLFLLLSALPFSALSPRSLCLRGEYRTPR